MNPSCRIETLIHQAPALDWLQIQTLALGYVLFVMLPLHGAIVVMLLNIQDELDGTSLLRDPGRAFHEALVSEHAFDERGVGRRVLRSIYRVFNSVFAVHIFRARAGCGG